MSNLYIVENSQNQRLLRGEWSLIQWNPDIATEELLNIGVALNIEGELQFKMLDYFERLTCLFDESVVQHLQDVIELSEHALKNNCTNFSDQIVWKTKGNTKGSSESEILDRLYNRVITLGKPCQNKNVIRHEFKVVHSNALINRITKNLRDSFKNEENLLRFLPSEKYIQHQDDSFLVPLRSEKAFGSIVSVVSSNTDKIKANYLTNVNDLKTAAIIENKEPTFFVLTPSDDELNKLDSNRADQIDSLIESLNRKQEQQGIKIESEYSEEVLKDKMAWWARRQVEAA
ncbi:hypothetical protein B9T24_15275 [Acinetobacter sp. ANC 4654]|uniref:DUF3037 domain-containing protein n=1 Tax=Acinetobacter sp. ANC 4654 TaxID=1977872 RepID=UPI000A343372|nr:DUF3037 domain-containing protein [Acinetobacter sp. ANC 4654]OTG92726.1 hypothetical protein B9T24_15275 [Acinetobacter sp. ANC 4654]